VSPRRGLVSLFITSGRRGGSTSAVCVRARGVSASVAPPFQRVVLVT